MIDYTIKRYNPYTDKELIETIQKYTDDSRTLKLNPNSISNAVLIEPKTGRFWTLFDVEAKKYLKIQVWLHSDQKTFNLKQ